jgi:acetyl esterase/lipase
MLRERGARARLKGADAWTLKSNGSSRCSRPSRSRARRDSGSFRPRWRGASPTRCSRRCSTTAGRGWRSSELFAAALQGAGVPAELHVYNGAPHAFAQMFMLDIAADAVDRIAAFARAQLG